MFVLGNADNSAIEITENQETNESKVIIQKNVTLLARLILTNQFYRATVKGLFQEFGYANPLTNTYISVEECDDILNKKYGDWAAVENKERYIIVGTEYIESNFNFKYEKFNYTQGLSFPRRTYSGYLVNETAYFRNDGSYFDDDSDYFKNIPEQIKIANAEAAYLAFKFRLLPGQNPESIADNITEIKNKVGPLETVKKFDSSKRETNPGSTKSKTFIYIEKLLKDFIISNSKSGSTKFTLDY